MFESKFKSNQIESNWVKSIQRKSNQIQEKDKNIDIGKSKGKGKSKNKDQDKNKDKDDQARDKKFAYVRRKKIDRKLFK